MVVFKYLPSRIFLLIVAASQQIKCQDTCHRTNCQKLIGDHNITYTSFTKKVDKKFGPSWTPYQTISVDGTQKQREQECAKQCSRHGINQCKGAQLSAYQASSPSQCGLIKDSVYKVFPAAVANIWVDSTGWTTFHVFVSALPQ